MSDTNAVRDTIVRELREDGYGEIRVFRTWLGRLRFVANQPDRRREIVVNPRTGVILRDYIRLNEVDDDEDDFEDEEEEDDGEEAEEDGDDEDDPDDGDDDDDSDDDGDGGDDDDD